MPSKPGGLDHLRRAPIACNYCRKRKTKCLGGGIGLTCRACAIAGQPCRYPDTQKTIKVPEEYLIELETRLKAYEQRDQSRTSTNEAVSQAPPAHGAESHRDVFPELTPQTIPESKNDYIDDNPLTEKIAHLVLSPEGDKRYFGNSSSTSLGKKFLDFIRSFKTGVDIGDDFITPTYSSASFSFRQLPLPLRPSSATLPHFEFAKRLYAAQYEYIGSIFSFTSPERFEINLREMYEREPDLSNLRDRLIYCEILIILAFGQMYSVNQWTSNDGPPGFEFFQQAVYLLPDIHERPSVTFVEVLSLIGYFFQNLNRRDAAFLYIGVALRMAISLGLHQEVSDDTLDDKTREYRRRLWWSVYSMDRILCVKSGNPLTIADEDIGVHPPSRLPDEPEICPATVLLHYTELSRILGKIMKNVYRTPRTTAYNLVSSVQSILAELTQWQMNLPGELQIDFSNLHGPISRVAVSIFLHYSQCINMTARPLVFNVVRKCLQNHELTGEWVDWRTGLQQSTILVVETCIAAARNSTAIMAAAFKQNLVATYGYMDGEHAFSAAIILVMINIAFPYNARDRAAMNQALDVLNGMAEKGNAHIRSLHRLLLQLCSTVGPASYETPHDDSATASAAPMPLTNTHVQDNGPRQARPDSHSPIPSSSTPHHAPPPENPFAAFLAAQQQFMTPATPAGVSGNDAATGAVIPHEFLSFENTTADATLWEEGYGTFDMGMEFDWVNWTA
ncbi:hypothetical protein VTO42DRAFT_5856 [Malbranchea cinnamomea]